MKITCLKPEELKDLIHIGVAFNAEAHPTGFPFDGEHWAACWSALIQGGTGVVMKATERKSILGVLGAVVSKDMNSGRLGAAELFWYVDPDARRSGVGLEILRAFEAWGREQGAEFLVLAALESCSPVQVGRLYEGLGYSKLETNYLQTIQG